MFVVVVVVAVAVIAVVVVVVAGVTGDGCAADICQDEDWMLIVCHQSVSALALARRGL